MGAVDVHFNFLYILSLTSHALIGFSLSLSLSLSLSHLLHYHN